MQQMHQQGATFNELSLKCIWRKFGKIESTEARKKEIENKVNT